MRGRTNLEWGVAGASNRSTTPDHVDMISILRGKNLSLIIEV